LYKQNKTKYKLKRKQTNKKNPTAPKNQEGVVLIPTVPQAPLMFMWAPHCHWQLHIQCATGNGTYSRGSLAIGSP